MELNTKEKEDVILEENNIEVLQEEIKEKILNEKKEEKIQVNEKGIIKKIFGILTKTVIITLIVIITTIAIRAMVFKKYDLFGFRMYLIMSGSMEPTIHISDAVIAKEQKIYKEGDIIAFDYDGVTTVHRITKIYHEGDKCLYQTKGDNNNTIDKGIHKEEQVIGKIILRIPKVGNIMVFIQKNFIVVAIGLITILLVGILIRRLM